jgi:hypothetical protein
VYYQYDARAGMAVTVIGRTKVGTDLFYIVLQPDGTRAQIPQWMLAPEAANLTVHIPPRISLHGLQTLRRELNVVLSSIPGATTDPGAKNEAEQRRGTKRFVQQCASAAGDPQFTSLSRRDRGIAGKAAVGGSDTFESIGNQREKS